jgi:Ca-activated chloride channel homolog
MRRAQRPRVRFMRVGEASVHWVPGAHPARMDIGMRALLGLLFLFSTTLTHAQDHTLSPYFLVEGGDESVEAFALESTRVTAHIAGMIADVTVQQRYRNGGDVPVHTRYVFPASTRAAVHGLSLQVGDKRVRAQIREREQAAAEFERAAQSGKTASLLEQDRPNVFSMAVANVLPGDQISVELHYSELLIAQEGVYEFVYPTVAGPRYARTSPDAELGPYMLQGDSPDSALELDIELAAGVPLTQLESDTHKLDVSYRDKSTAHVRLARSQTYAGNRDFILHYRLTGAQPESGLLLHEGARESYFLLMLQPPARVEHAALPAREYVFVLDVSGSMRGFPLDTAKQLITQLALGLRAADSFNVILFSGQSRLLSPESLQATPANVQRALALVDDESGGGGTELEAALQRALGLPRRQSVSRSVVLITDGYIAQERGAFELIEKNLGDTNVFAFGIGSSVNRYLVEGVARTGRGEPFIVTQPSEAAEQAQRFRKYIERPVLRHVRVRFSGFDAYDVEPSVQPDLFAERPIVVFGKWRGPRRGTVQITADAPSGGFARTLQIASVSAGSHAALPQLWARSRIAHLSDFAAEPEADADKITALGLEYSLLTPYTSFVAVLEQLRNPGGAALHTAVPVALPLGMELDESCGAYAAGAEPELYLLLMAAAFMALFMQLRRKVLS